MEFGLFDHIEGIPGTSMHQLLRDRIELVKLLDANGFSGYHVAEHHGTDLCLAPNQEIFLAAAAEATTRIRLGPMVKLLPLHHPLRVIEDICVLDQLTGGRVDYGVGRGIAPIEHFWFDGDWFNSHDRFDEALASDPSGIANRQSRPGGREALQLPSDRRLHDPLPAAEPAVLVPGQPGHCRPVRVEPDVARADPARGLRPLRPELERVCGRPRTGRSTGQHAPRRRRRPHRRLSRRIRGQGDRRPGLEGSLPPARRTCTNSTALALDEEEAEAALNPQAQAAFALVGPGGDALLPQFTASSGTPAQVRARIEQYIADGRCDYLVLQLPTGDMTMEEARASIQLFIDEVMPNFV